MVCGLIILSLFNNNKIEIFINKIAFPRTDVLSEETMLVQKDFLSKLKAFGLNSYEAKLWTALLSRGVSTAGEISDISDVPRSRSYDVLESLEKKGFVMVKLGKPIKYLAVAPDAVLERVKQRVNEEAESQTRLLSELEGSAMLKELSLLYKTGIKLVEPSDLSGMIKGRKNIHNHLENAIRQAEQCVYIMTTADGLKRKADVVRNAVRKYNKSIAINIAAPINKDNIAAAQSLKGIAEVRHTNIPSRLVLTDKKKLTFMVMDEKEVNQSLDIGIWAESPLFANSLADLFESQWKKLPPAEKALRK